MRLIHMEYFNISSNLNSKKKLYFYPFPDVQQHIINYSYFNLLNKITDMKVFSSNYFEQRVKLKVNETFNKLYLHGPESLTAGTSSDLNTVHFPRLVPLFPWVTPDLPLTPDSFLTGVGNISPRILKIAYCTPVMRTEIQCDNFFFTILLQKVALY